MQQLRKRLDSRRKKLHTDKMTTVEKETVGALFDDIYANRQRIYRFNFFRGIFFGFGSVLGGTLVIAIAAWMLTWFIDFPLIGQWIEKIISALPSL